MILVRIEYFPEAEAVTHPGFIARFEAKVNEMLAQRGATEEVFDFEFLKPGDHYRRRWDYRMWCGLPKNPTTASLFEVRFPGIARTVLREYRIQQTPTTEMGPKPLEGHFVFSDIVYVK